MPSPLSVRAVMVTSRVSFKGITGSGSKRHAIWRVGGDSSMSPRPDEKAPPKRGKSSGQSLNRSCLLGRHRHWLHGRAVAALKRSPIARLLAGPPQLTPLEQRRAQDDDA